MKFEGIKTSVSKGNRRKTLLMVVFFMCFGITSEVVFTALYSAIYDSKVDGILYSKLEGFSYVWMIFIYGLIPFIAYLIHPIFRNIFLPLRIFIYVLILYSIEWFSGWMLETFTGACPWEYSVGWHVFGYIRLDYFPVWYLFAFMVEKIFIFLDNRVAVTEFSISHKSDK